MLDKGIIDIYLHEFIDLFSMYKKERKVCSAQALLIIIAVFHVNGYLLLCAFA